jgi:serine/threonine-protein kinase
LTGSAQLPLYQPDPIALQVVNALRLHQVGGPAGIAIRQFTRITKAYDLYLEGRYHAGEFNEAGLWKAIHCYKGAIAADLSYAPAHAGLAEAYSALTLLNETPPRETMRLAKQAAEYAVKTGHLFAHGHSALGSVLALYDWNWAEAEKEFHRALELDPNDPGIRRAYALHYLLPQGRISSALFEMHVARGLVPFSPEVALGLGKVHHFNRDSDQAIKAFQRVLHLEPSFETAPLALAAAYVQRGLLDQALNTLREAMEPTEDEARFAVLGQVYALSGQQKAARQVLQELYEVARQRYVSGYYFAILHLALDERTAALDWLERAVDERCPLMAYLKVDPEFDLLRADSRFGALVRKVGLAR